MSRPLMQAVSLAAIVVGTILFAATLFFIDREETVKTLARLGRALPVVLLPSVVWHVFRTWGWYVCFPDRARPSFWRIFQVRLAADAVAYFTVRGVASEPLRVVLLLDRVPATISAAATVLERLTMGVLSALLVGLTASAAMQSDRLPDAWQEVFRAIAIGSGLLFAIALALLFRRGRYLGPLFERLHQRRGWRWTHGRVVQFVTEVELLALTLVRTDWQRIRIVSLVAVICFVLMVLEVFAVFWAIGVPVSTWVATMVETFTRTASIFGGAIPGNLGALEAANVMVVKAFGLNGAGSLALARRVRTLLWAGLGLALYPRDTFRTPSDAPA